MTLAFVREYLMSLAKLPLPEQRFLTRDQAAQYCGFNSVTASFDQFAKDNGLRKVPGRRGCYDKRQIDLALDSLMGLTASHETEQNEADAWFAMRERRKRK